MIELFRTIYMVLFGLGSLACWGFVFRYGTNFKWYSTLLGRHLMSVSTVCGLIYTWNFIVIALPDWNSATHPSRLIVSLSLFGGFTILLMWRLVIFEKLARQLRDDKKNDVHTDSVSIAEEKESGDK